MNPRYSNAERECLLHAAYLLAREAGFVDITGENTAKRAERSWQYPQTMAAIGVLHSAALTPDWRPA